MADEPRIPTQDELKRKGWDTPAADYLNDELTKCAHALTDCRAQLEAMTRERDEAREQSLAARNLGQRHCDERDSLRAQLEEVTKERDEWQRRANNLLPRLIDGQWEKIEQQGDDALTRMAKLEAAGAELRDRLLRSGYVELISTWDAAVKPEQP